MAPPKRKLVEKSKEEVKEKDVESEEEIEDEEMNEEEVDDEEVAEDDELEEPSEGTSKSIDPEEKQKKSGVLYFPTIPPRYTIKRMLEYFEKLAPGQIGRIYLMRNKFSKSLDSRYSDGWLEIKKKKIAKQLAASVDNTLIGGSRRDPVSTMFWNIRYLSGFKWVHLQEQLQYEKQVEKKRMQVEIAQARRVAAHFEESVEKGRHLKKLEEKVRSQGGKWQEFHREVKQNKALKSTKQRKNKASNEEKDQVMQMIFG